VGDLARGGSNPPASAKKQFIMNNYHTFSFETAEPNEYVGKTCQERNQKYLVATLSGCSIIKVKANYLLVPDDNSILANHLKNNLHYDYSFNTPFSNLKFKPGS
jgi:hypothetical protein